MFSKTGDTIVSGNLDIISSNTEINSDDINIKNNIIILNSKETSNKVSNNVAGLEINRGTSLPYQILYDERDSELKSGLSNNLKPISSEEYTTTNVTNAKTDLNTQIYKNDFMNELPKIGYYQEDTVEVLSKYNMNYSPETDNNKLAMFCLTSDSNNREILYYLGNDGSQNSSDYHLFYAYRTNDNSQFTFINSPFDNFISGETAYSALISCGNTWIVLQGKTGKYYLVHTNYSFNPNNWTYDDIDFCLKDNFSGIKLYGCRYFDAYDLLTWYECCSNNFNNTKMFRFYAAKVKEKTIKFKQDFDSPNQCMYIYNTQSNSYKNDLSETIEAAYKYSNNGGTNLYNGWQAPGMLYDQENQRLIYYTQNSTLRSFLKSSGKKVEHNSYIKAIYKIPNSILTSYSGTITLLNSKTIDRNKTQLQNSNYGTILTDYTKSYTTTTSIQMQCSYDEKNRRNYRMGTSRDVNYDKRCFRNNCDDNPLITSKSYDSENFMKQGDNNTKTISASGMYYCLQPDASVWGKRLSFYNMLEADIWHGYSKVNNSMSLRLFTVSEYQKIKNFEGSGFIGIEPIPSKYFLLSSSYTSPYSNWNYSTTVLENGDSYYCNVSSSEDNLSIKHYIPKTTIDSNFNYTSSLEFEDNYNNYPFENNHKVRVGNYNCSLRNMQYNKVGNWYLILVIVDDPNAINESYYKNSYIGIIRRDTKTIKVFDWNYMSKFSNNIRNAINWGNTRKLYNVNSWITQSIFVNKTTVIICFRVIGEQNTYITRRGIIQFNDSLDDIVSCKDCTNLGAEIASNGIFEAARNFTYSKKYGYAFTSVENYGGSKVSYYTQKPLLASQYESDRTVYSMEDVLINANCHHYKMFLQASQGLICYVPSIPIFLGGYFEVIQNPISVNLKPNTNNYIYLERDLNTNQLKAYALTTKDIEEGSKQFSRILLARVLTNDANPIETEYYRINTGYNDYTFYHKITIKQTPNQTIHVYTTENGQRVDHTTSFFVKINSNIQYSIEIKPDLWYVAGTLQNISSSGIINQNITVSTTTANLISTNYSYDFKMEYVPSNDPPIYRFGNNYSSTFPDGQNYKGNVTPIDQLGIYTNLDSVIHYRYTKPLPDEIKSVFIKLVCKDGEHFLGHFIRDEFDQYGDVYHSKVLGTQENLNLFKRLYDTKEVFTCVTGVET